MSTDTDNENVSTAVRVALLSAAVGEVQKKQNEMAEHGRNSMDRVTAELKEIGRRIDGLGPVSHKQQETDDAIRRIWSHIHERDKRNDETRDKANRIHWIGFGAACVLSVAAGAFSFGLAARLTPIDREVEALRAADARKDDRIDRLEIHAAGDPDRPYKR